MIKLMSKTDDQIISKIIRLMGTDTSVDAPQGAISWSKNIFLTRASKPEKSLTQKVLAVLQIDLSPTKAAFGERSASASKARQMLFQAGDANIDLRVKQEENGFSLHGQILGEDFADGVIKLGDFETSANEVSEFKFVKIPKGKYNLYLQKDDKEIVIEGLQFD